MSALPNREMNVASQSVAESGDAPDSREPEGVGTSGAQVIADGSRTQHRPIDIPEISIRILWCPAMYLRDTFGAETLGQRCAEAGFSAADVDTGKLWISA